MVSRDALLAAFWPDLDEEHARNALNKSLHFLREALGANALPSRGRAWVTVDGDRVECDAVAFRSALARGDAEEALALYQGSFAPGLHVSDAPDFQDWVDGERRYYGGKARVAGLELLHHALEQKEATEALRWARLLDRIAPHDEGAVRGSVAAHVAVGDLEEAGLRVERYAAWLGKVGGAVPVDLGRMVRTSPVPRELQPRRSAGSTRRLPETSAASPTLADERDGPGPPFTLTLRLREASGRPAPHETLSILVSLIDPAVRGTDTLVRHADGTLQIHGAAGGEAAARALRSRLERHLHAPEPDPFAAFQLTCTVIVHHVRPGSPPDYQTR